MQKNKGAEQIKATLAKLKGIKQADNLFETLHRRGEGMTFDDEGMPLLYKQKVDYATLQAFPTYQLHKHFETVKPPSYSYKSRQQLNHEVSQDDEETWAGYADIKLVIAAGATYSSKKEFVSGPTLSYNNKLSRTDYAKMAANQPQPPELKKL